MGRPARARRIDTIRTRLFGLCALALTGALLLFGALQR